MSTPILADSNPNVQKRTILAEDTQTAADYEILTPAELELSKYVNAEFYTASVQVPNGYSVLADGSSEAIYDHSDPVFKDFDMVRISTPNAASGAPTVTDQYVTSFHIKRWPDRWKAYKSGTTKGVDGIPITDLTSIPPGAITKLQAAGVFTIEQLARHPDAGALILNGVLFQTAARKHLSQQETSKSDQLKAELEDMKAQLAQLLEATKTKAK
jgi:hypothetical protein